MQIFEQQNAVKMHFFDYSLWNYYVNVRLPPFMPETRPSLLSFILFFALALLALSLSPSFIQNTATTRIRHGIGLGLRLYIVLSVTLALTVG